MIRRCPIIILCFVANSLDMRPSSQKKFLISGQASAVNLTFRFQTAIQISFKAFALTHLTLRRTRKHEADQHHRG
jgi:hypothetical protein